jgi:hypothetical protein
MIHSSWSVPSSHFFPISTCHCIQSPAALSSKRSWDERKNRNSLERSDGRRLPFKQDKGVEGSIPGPATQFHSLYRKQEQRKCVLGLRRTHKDPFAGEWVPITSWLLANSERSSGDIFGELQPRSPGRYQPVQIRTLQRGMRKIRAHPPRKPLRSNGKQKWSMDHRPRQPFSQRAQSVFPNQWGRFLVEQCALPAHCNQYPPMQRSLALSGERCEALGLHYPRSVVGKAGSRSLRSTVPAGSHQCDR